MKLLFDENLSVKLVAKLHAEYPRSTHVDGVGLHSATDLRIWEYAKANGFVLVSKDDDFRNLSLVKGAPPKVLWLNLGNVSTDTIAKVLKDRYAEIKSFAASPEEALLVLK